MATRGLPAWPWTSEAADGLPEAERLLLDGARLWCAAVREGRPTRLAVRPPFLAEDAVIVDQEETFRGREETYAFLRDAGTEFEYTTEQIGAHRVDDTHWVVTVRLEGTFPGGVAGLDHRFALRDDLIGEPVIATHPARPNSHHLQCSEERKGCHPRLRLGLEAARRTRPLTCCPWSGGARRLRGAGAGR